MMSRSSIAPPAAVPLYRYVSPAGVRVVLTHVLGTVRPGLRQLSWLCAVPSLRRTWQHRDQWRSLRMFGDRLGVPVSRHKFYLRCATDCWFGRLFCAAPDRYLPLVEVQGRDEVDAVRGLGRGAVVLGNHAGPLGLYTVILEREFGVSLGSFAAPAMRAWLAAATPRTSTDRALLAAPVYCRGEERQVVEALRRGEWLHMMIDIDLAALAPREPNCTVLGQPLTLSMFPFRLALKYDIPLLLTNTLRPPGAGKIVVRFARLTDFATPEEGLQRYVANLHRQLAEDPYSNRRAPTWFGTT